MSLWGKAQPFYHTISHALPLLPPETNCDQQPRPAPAASEFVEQKRVFNFDWTEYTYGGVVMHPKQMTARELAEAFLRSWRKFSSFRGILKRLGWNIFGRQKLLLWVINLGINRVLRYGLNKPLIAKNDPESVAAVAAVPKSLPENGLYSIDRLYKHRLHIVPRERAAAATAEPKA